MESIATDATVLSIGVRSRNELEKEVSGCCDRLYVIGDAKKPDVSEMPRAVPLKWQEKYNNRQKFIEKRADHPYSEIIVQEELLVFIT